MSRPRLGVIGAGPDQIPLIERGRQLGCEVVTIDASLARIGHSLSSLAPIITDLADRVGMLSKISRYALDGLTSVGSEIGLQAFGYCARELGLPNAVPVPALDCSIDKRMQRQILDKLAIPSPRRVYWNRSHRDPPAGIQGWECDEVIVKPIDRWGSLGTSIVAVRDPQEGDLATAFHQAYEAASSYSDLSDVIVEEVVLGQEFGTNVRISSGEVVSIAANARIAESSGWRPVGCFPIHFHAVGTLFDAAPPDWLIIVENFVSAIVAELAPAWSGIVNADVIVSDGFPYILEFSFRGGGFGTPLLYDLFFGAGQVDALIIDSLCNSRWSDQIQERTDLATYSPASQKRPVSLSLAGNDVLRLLATLPGRMLRDDLVSIRNVYVQNDDGGSSASVNLRRRSRGSGLTIVEITRDASYAEFVSFLRAPS